LVLRLVLVSIGLSLAFSGIVHHDVTGENDEGTVLIAQSQNETRFRPVTTMGDKPDLGTRREIGHSVSPAPLTEVSPAPVNEPAAPLSTTTSSSTTTTATSSEPEYRGQAALQRIAYRWQSQLPGWTIIFSSGRDGTLGYTYVDRKTIEIFVRSSQSDALLAHVIAHELGHAIDVTMHNGDDRRRWQDGRGIGASAWWPGEGVSDFSTGAGDFAESFAAWQLGPADFRSNLAGPPNPAQVDLLEELTAN
jgi:hypothetical protein